MQKVRHSNRDAGSPVAPMSVGKLPFLVLDPGIHARVMGWLKHFSKQISF
jgi:hypothetical protein